MIAQPISYKRLHEALNIAFKDDKDIYKYFDPNVNVEKVEDIVSDIEKKVKEFGDSVVMKGIYEKGKLVGYFVFLNDLLISFALNVAFRTRSYLRKFFDIIKKEIGHHFVCFLWTRNIRAIKWLLKMGMIEVSTNSLITKLICQ